MVMQPSTSTDPGMVHAEIDMGVRKGTEMDDRPLIGFADVKAYQDSGRGVQLKRFGLVMRAPSTNGIPGGGVAVIMPADKFQKWWGQGYRPTKTAEDHSLYEFAPPPAPTRWLASMVEEAIAAGDPIPEDMAPAGYYGPTFAARKRRGSRSETDQPE